MCSEGFVGQNCENVLDACANNTCLNGGSCQATASQETFICQCLPGTSMCKNSILSKFG